MTRLKMNAAAAMPFFAQAFKAGKGQCDNDVKLATVAALDLSPSQDAKNIAAAQEIAFGSCFAAFKTDLIENVSKSHPNFLTNACKGLNEKKVLQGVKAAWCKKT